jgi:hypothetical protein
LAEIVAELFALFADADLTAADLFVSGRTHTAFVDLAIAIIIDAIAADLALGG